MQPLLTVLPHALAIATIVGACCCALALMMANPSLPNLQDASLNQSLALPSAASTTVTSTGIDTGATTADAYQIGGIDYLLTAPALNTTQLPDTKTVTYSILVSAAANMGTPTTLSASVIVQTGAGGVGAASATYRFRLPSQLPGGTGIRYVGFKAVTGAATGDCSAASATLQPMF
jgi:hypothetical protein